MNQFLVGLALWTLAGWLVVNAFRRRQHAATPVARPLHPSLASLATLGPPVITTLLAFAALKSTVVWALIDRGRIFSAFDLAGYLAVLGAYAWWLRAQRQAPTTRRAANDDAGSAIDAEHSTSTKIAA